MITTRFMAHKCKGILKGIAILSEFSCPKVLGKSCLRYIFKGYFTFFDRHFRSKEFKASNFRQQGESYAR